MVNIKKKHPKTDPKKLMALVVDEELLKKRKEAQTQKEHHPKQREVKKEPYTKWSNLKKNDFIKKEFKGLFYGQHKEWKKRIWIGPYKTEDELDKVINSYVKETKKDTLNRNIKNIHSILLDID